MQYDDQLGSNVLNQIRSLPFWMDFEKQVAVAIVGSVGAEMGDVHSDLDVYILVPEEDSIPLYENYKKGYEDGTIDVLNPLAFQFNEFPMVELKDAKVVSYTHFPRSTPSLYAVDGGDANPLKISVEGLSEFLPSLRTGIYYLWLPDFYD